MERALILSALFVLNAAGLFAQESTAGGERKPTNVDIGIYLLDVYDLDLKNGSYVADFYIWLRWKGELDPRKFELMNGELDVKENPDERKIGDINYVCYRVRGKFRAPFDFRDFPLDRQKLTIEIEDSSNDIGALVYQADLQNTSASHIVDLTGWELAGMPAYKVVTHAYETNYGNPPARPDRRPFTPASWSMFRSSMRATN